MFNEGYTPGSGPAPRPTDLTAEAIRLTRLLHTLLPAEGEVAGLLALLLLTDARRSARTTADGSLVSARRPAAGAVGLGADPGRGGADHPHPRRDADRSVPVAGRDRRRARRGAQCGRRRDGGRAAGRPGADRHPGHRRTHGTYPPGSTPSAGTCWPWPASRRPPASRTCGRAAHRKPARAALSHAAGGPLRRIHRRPLSTRASRTWNATPRPEHRTDEPRPEAMPPIAYFSWPLGQMSCGPAVVGQSSDGGR